MRRYGYVGMPGGYGEEALLTHFKGGIKPVSSPSVLSLIQGIQTDQLDGGILPVAPGQEGELLESMGLAQGETFSIQVQQCLLALPGQDLYEVIQVLAQDWVRAACVVSAVWHYLAVQWVEVPDAAASARQIWQQHLAGVGVVAPARAAALYHLKVLAGIPEDVVTPPEFVLLRRSPARGSSGSRITRVLAPLEDFSVPAGTGNGWHDEPRYGEEGALSAAAHFSSTTRNGETALALLEAAPAAPSAAPDRPSSSGQRPCSPSAPAIVLTDVCKAYGKGKHQRWAVNHLTLEVEQGSIFGLLGPNGSGKTTTVNLLCGLLRPNSGSLRILGFDSRRARDLRQIRQRLGAVPQETALYEELTAHENLAFHAGLYGVPHRQRQRRIEEMLKLAGLFDRRQDRVKTFSGGMKRRLAIARALLHDPQLLYLDEPTLGVDVQSRRAIWDYILALRDQGKTVLITTNYLEEAQALCDRLAIIDHGRLIALDTPARLKERYGASVIELDLASPFVALERLERLEGVLRVTPNRQRTHLTITTQRMNEVLPRLLAQFSEPPTSIAVHEPNLDDVFLQLTGAALRD